MVKSEAFSFKVIHDHWLRKGRSRDPHSSHLELHILTNARRGRIRRRARSSRTTNAKIKTKGVLVLYVMYGVVNEVWCRPCPTNLQSPTHCVLLWLFCGWGAAEVSRGRSAAFPRLTTSRSGAPGRTVGEVEDSRKDALVCTACGVTRASLVRARAARAFSEAAESRRAVAHVPGVRVYCTGCGAVRGASVSSH